MFGLSRASFGLALLLAASQARAASPAIEVAAPRVSEQADVTRVVVAVRGRVHVTAVITERRILYRLAGAKLGREVDRGALVPASNRSIVGGILAIETDAGVDLVLELRGRAVAKQAVREDEGATTIEIQLTKDLAAPPPSAAPLTMRDDDRSAPPRSPSIAPVLFDAPVTRTCFGFDLELGDTNLYVPRSPTSTPTPATLASAFQSLSFGLRLLDWAGVDVATRTRLVFGATDATSKAVGSDVLFGGHLGASLFLDRLGRGTTVALRAAGDASTGTELNTAKTVVQNATMTLAAPETLDDVSAPLSEHALRLSVYGAQVLGPLKLEASIARVGFEHAISVGPAKTRKQHRYAGTNLEAGFAASLDAGLLTATVEYAISKPLARSAEDAAGTTQILAFEDAQALGGGVYFTGRKELSLGLFASATLRDASLAKVSRGARLAFLYMF